MNVEQFIGSRQSMLITCRPEDTVKSAATLLATNRIGAMPVIDEEGTLIGLLSERDVVKAMAMRGSDVLKLLVGELMSRNPVTCSVDDHMDRAMMLMDRHRFRHLPVMDDGELVGIVSIRDALEVAAHDKEMEANVMRDISIAARAR
jgi:CBS domain-containing protein